MSPYVYLPMLTHLVCHHTLTYQFYVTAAGGRARLPHLIVAPTSVVMAWQKEVKRWCPQLDPAVYRGTMKERAQLRYTLKTFGVLIVGYAPLRCVRVG